MNVFEALVAAGPNEIVDALADYLTPPEWHERAACRGAGPELFYPERGGNSADGLALCNRCPVVDECRAHGLAHERHGTWGALTASDRQKHRRQRKEPTR